MVHRHGNFHDRMVELARRQDAVFSTEGGTVYSIVYQTATPTFTGVIGGYTTLAGDDSTTDSAPTPASSDANAPAAAPTTANDSPSPVQPSTAATQTTASATNATPLTSAIVASTSTTAILGSTNTANVAAASTTANSSSSDSSSSGMSTGAKAGIAIAVIAIVGLLAVFLLWLLGKKRRQLEAQKTVDNEKHVPGAGTIAAASVNSTEMATRSPPISATAPRISLRPVSRMLPEFMGASKSRLSGGNLLNTIGEADSITSRKTPSPGPRGPSPTQPRGLGLGQPVRPSEDNNPFADPKNPFADPEKSSVEYPAPLAITPSVTKQAPIAPMAATIVGAAATSAAVAPKPAPTRAAAPGPAPAPALVSAPVSEPTPVIAPVPAAAPAPVPVPIAVPAPKPAQESAPSPTSSGPASPALSSTPSQGAEPQGNVYRVLMDFAPSMEDELELKSGQLVRLLHEYDDGWALCIRLDRSQQGVVPRTCLAAKPSKPKPSHLNQYARPPPGGPMSRPMSPAGGPPRPMSPAGRPMSPMGRPMSPAGRPMSPAGQRRPMSPGFNQGPRPMSPGPRPRPGQQGRSMSPGPYAGRNGPPPMAGAGRPRSNSATNPREKRNVPAGPSKLGPGTGMAL